MLRLRWTTALFLVGGVSAILLHFFSRIKGFPEGLMLVFLPAEHFWRELQNEAGREMLGRIVSNVAVFGLLAGAEGALIGLILDLRTAGGQTALSRRVKHLRRGTEKMDLAFQRRVQEILSKHDPLGLIKAGADKDAYAPQAKMILSRLGRARSTRGLGKFCRQRFRQHFGWRAAGSFKEYDCLAEQISTAYRRQQSPERQELPASKGL